MSCFCLKILNTFSYLQNKFKLHTTEQKGTHGLVLDPFPSLLWWPSLWWVSGGFSIHYHSWHSCCSCTHCASFLYLFLCDPSIWSTKPSPTSNTTTKPVLLWRLLLKYLFPFRGFPNVLSSMMYRHSLFSLLFPSVPHHEGYLWRFTLLPVHS